MVANRIGRLVTEVRAKTRKLKVALSRHIPPLVSGKHSPSWAHQPRPQHVYSQRLASVRSAFLAAMDSTISPTLSTGIPTVAPSLQLQVGLKIQNLRNLTSKHASGDSSLPDQAGKTEVPPLAAYLIDSSMYLSHEPQ